MTGLPFIKMHGLGNDFVVLDARSGPLGIGPAQARAIADRRRGVGCDQLLIVEASVNGAADIFLRIHNADGGEAEACGNGARCVAAMIMAETGARETAIETKAGLLAASAAGDGLIAVDLGPVGLDWQSIPLARETDTLNLGIEAGPLSDPVAVSIGNPHMVFFVDDAEAVPLEDLGPGLEADPLYPERANVGVAEILRAGGIRLRVWERGAGVTPACGSGACAALVAASRRGLTARKAAVVVDGGTLHIEWLEDNHVVMTGPVATSFSGTLDPALLS